MRCPFGGVSNFIGLRYVGVVGGFKKLEAFQEDHFHCLGGIEFIYLYYRCFLDGHHIQYIVYSIYSVYHTVCTVYCIS